MRLEEIFKFGRRTDDAALARMNEQIRSLTKEKFLRGVKEVAPEQFKRPVSKGFVAAEKEFNFELSLVRGISRENVLGEIAKLKKKFASDIQKIVKLIK